MGEVMNDYLLQIEAIRQENRAPGGMENVEQLHARGKLTAREKIDLLADADSFEELGSLVRERSQPLDGKERSSACDGAIIGQAKIDSRPVIIWATDFSVMSGSIGDQATWKIGEAIQYAGKWKVPVIGIVDTVGTRLNLKDGGVGIDGFARILRNQSLYSAVIPRITLIMGYCAGIFAHVATMSDFVIMSRNNSCLWLGGSRPKGAGSSEYHMEYTGTCDLICDDEKDVIEKTKKLLSYLPQNCFQKPPFVDTDDDPNRRDEKLLHVIPNDPRWTYDIHDVIAKITDNGEFFEIKEDFAKNFVLGFARFGGRVVGICANNPDEMAGILEPDSSDKYYRFMMFLDAFNIPMVDLVDTTAFVPGDVWERKGVLHHGAKLLHSYSIFTAPKVTIQLRRAYGGANLVMGSRGMRSDFVYGWPTLEMAPTGPDTVVHAVFNRELEQAKKEGRYDEVYFSFRNKLAALYSVIERGKDWTGTYTVHDVVDPRDTRRKICKAIEIMENKDEEIVLPDKKHGVEPP